MGTAVVRPHGCLSPSQGRRSRNFFHKTAATRLDKKPSSLQYMASGPEMDSGGDVHYRHDRGLVACMDTSAGLLPLPDNLVGRAYSSLHKAPSKCRVGERMELNANDNQIYIRCHQRSWIPYYYYVSSSSMLARRASTSGSRNAAWARLSPAAVQNSNLVGSVSCVAGEELPPPEIYPPSNSHLLGMTDVKQLHGNKRISYRKKEHASTEAHGCCLYDEVATVVQESLCKASGDGLSHKWHLTRSASENVPASGLYNDCRGEISLAYVHEKVPLQLKVSIKGGTDNGDRVTFASKGGADNGDIVDAARTSSTLASAVERCMSFSTMQTEKWAGPSFFNSPSPSALPVPSFTVRPSTTLSASSTTADGTALACLSTEFEAKRSWDVA